MYSATRKPVSTSIRFTKSHLQQALAVSGDIARMGLVYAESFSTQLIGCVIASSPVNEPDPRPEAPIEGG
jgi:hypothetical protein